MLAAYTKLQNAETVKQHLLKKDLLNHGYLPVKELGFIYFPVVKNARVPKSQVLNTKFSFPEKEKSFTVEGLLKNKLTQKEINLLPKTKEVIGRVMVLEIPTDLQKKEKVIAAAYLKANPQIETIVKKSEIHSGEYRTRKVKVLAGKSRKETTHRENGVDLKLHLENAYFSSRLGSERLRIANQVKKGEEVMVMFSGVAPYPLVLAKNSKATKIYGIELNPVAHTYAMENVMSNKAQNKVFLKCGDVRKEFPKLRQKFDRIVMPLPRNGEEYLDLALKKSKSGTVIHFYSFFFENTLKEEVKKIKDTCKELGQPVKLMKVVRCGQSAPGTFRYCLDLKVV